MNENEVRPRGDGCADVCVTAARALERAAWD